MGCIKNSPADKLQPGELPMKKVLAAIIEYKLNKNNLKDLMLHLIKKLEAQPNPYPITFKQTMYALSLEIKDFCDRDALSPSEEDFVMDALKEMELVLVDYLTPIACQKTNDCFLR